MTDLYTGYPMLTETVFDDKRSALEEAGRIRAASRDSDLFVKVDASPYGGWRIRVVPMDIALGLEGLPYFLSGR